MQRNFEPMRRQVEAWQRSELTDVTAKVVIYEAFVEGKLEAPKHRARNVHDLYFEPKYEEFQARTIWSLSNAFTSAFKELDPIPQFKATANLGEFLEARFRSRSSPGAVSTAALVPRMSASRSTRARRVATPSSVGTPSNIGQARELSQRCLRPAGSNQMSSPGANAHLNHARHYLSVLGQANDLYVRGREFVSTGIALFELEFANIASGQAWASSEAEKNTQAARLVWSTPTPGFTCLTCASTPSGASAGSRPQSQQHDV
jgi:hypothetical protein